jgi:hypothetical protein
MLLVQPPCPEPVGRQTAAEFEAELSTPIDPYDIAPKNEEAVLVGTERWCAVELAAKSRARGCWVDVGGKSGEVEEGKWWPGSVRPWRFGAWLENGVFEFGEPVEWKL